METAKSGGKTGDIIATAKASSTFKSFSRAVQAAGLEATLEGTGPFTVFAPTDDAFGKLPAGKLDSLLESENRSELVALLKQHVVSGGGASTVTKTMELETLGGSARELKIQGSTVSIDGSRVTQADIACSNGVIHAIDTVMLPPRK